MAATNSLAATLLFTSCLYNIRINQADAFAFVQQQQAAPAALLVSRTPSLIPVAFSRSFQLKAEKGSSGRSSDANNDEPQDDNNDKTPRQGPAAKWKLRNDFGAFLTQCSIQSFLTLCKTMREPQTVLWLKNYTQATIQETEQPTFSAAAEEEGGVAAEDVTMPVGESDRCRLLSYHGLNAMNMTAYPTFESYFVGLMESPLEKYTVESSLSYVPDYDIEIDPPRLCGRILSVREQIAREFANDLQVLSKMGDEALIVGEQAPAPADHDPDDLDGREIKIENHNLMFLDLDCDGRAPSLLRKGNFDLLKLLATQEAIHRLLNDSERQDSALASSNAYLEDFYSNRLMSHFDGDQPYGRADQFVRELLNAPPALRSQSMVDPAGIAREILAKRQEVATEWSALSKRIPEEHVVIRRLQLEQLMSGSASTSGQSFEEALRGGSCSDETDTSASVPFFTHPTTPVEEELIANKERVEEEEDDDDDDDDDEDEYHEEEAADSNYPVHGQLELIGSGGGGHGLGTLNMTESVFE